MAAISRVGDRQMGHRRLQYAHRETRFRLCSTTRTRANCPTLKLLRDEAGINETLDSLARGGGVSRYDGGTEPVFKIEPGQHTVAAFYRNSAIHWFVNRAILEVSLLDDRQDAASGPLEQAWEQAFALRDLPKFEFFFSEKQAFRELVVQSS